MNSRPAIIAALGLGVATATPAAAQWDGVCATVRPLPSCRIWIVTEVGAEFPMTSTSRGRFSGPSSRKVKRDINNHVVGTVGAMTNHGQGSFGITASLMGTGGGKDGARAEARYRRTTKRGSLQASIGAARWGVHGLPGTSAETATGLTSGIGFDRGWIGAEARMDFLRTHDRPVQALAVGVHLGETPARLILKTAAILLTIARFLPPD